ncbi:MAG: hypothetical protein M0Z65_00990 [Firmicutes bacterium]|uniref:Uncharacterized protein n=1 Tax=Melghirimyces thermohalophilus TaxID=1236220 RepID=A0A1G6I8I8_9BACL|nr:hypothetical protein [Melghirimyces thermohalophilus]MDA8351775.1 hypothetical protein [Bacillota bacterium]SDC02852.1 hypothetical protein SAMN04488112_102116 [Melghirimyces thermohalophilus]
MRRWVGYWLTLCLGVPVLLALIYVIVYQRLLDSPRYYPFWLIESYFYLGLPAVALITWKVHWGKKHPLPYLVLILVLISGVLVLGTYNIKKYVGDQETKRLHPVGVVDQRLVAREGNYHIPYYPVDDKALIEVIKKGEGVDVTVVPEKKLLLSFKDPAFKSYSLLQRVIDLALGILAMAVFAVFFYVVMSIWWRDFRMEGDALLVQNWGRVKRIPLFTIIQMELDPLHEEIRFETEELFLSYPYDSDRAKELAKAAREAGLKEIRRGKRWVRSLQYREVRLEERRIVLDGQEQLFVPFDWVVSLRWDPVVQITLMDETHYTITDSRYMDRAWFEELTKKVKGVWKQDGYGYVVDHDLQESAVTLTLMD